MFGTIPVVQEKHLKRYITALKITECGEGLAHAPDPVEYVQQQMRLAEQNEVDDVCAVEVDVYSLPQHTLVQLIELQAGLGTLIIHPEYEIPRTPGHWAFRGNRFICYEIITFVRVLFATKPYFPED